MTTHTQNPMQTLAIGGAVENGEKARDHVKRGELLDALNELARARDGIEAATYLVVSKLRAEGHSWAMVGRCLGITKQGAQQRYGD